MDIDMLSYRDWEMNTLSSRRARSLVWITDPLYRRVAVCCRVISSTEL